MYYEEYGEGITILFLEGLGYSTWMWFRQVEELSKKYRCLLVDNRGVGKSSQLKAPYTIDLFARDALAVLDERGIESAYVLGVSMGGFIAQTIAGRAEKRVRGLILISTSCGGKFSLPMPKETWDELTKDNKNEDERGRIERVMRIAFTDSFPLLRRDEFNRIIEMRMNSLQDRQQWLFQAMSSLGFDSYTSNLSLKVPALIMAGMKDRVIPWLNSLYLFKSIQNSSLALFTSQNHLLFIEEYERINSLIDSFIKDTLDDRFTCKVEVF